jgi:shikimate kinase
MLTVSAAARWRPLIAAHTAFPNRVRLPRTLVLVGLMGAGKTAIGRRLAGRLGLRFVDADQEVEEAAGCSVEDIFDRYGEPAFRDVERRVIARLLHEPVHVLATGGGAFMDPETRELIARRGISLWLRADLEVLLARTGRRTDRPLLKAGDPREVMARLQSEREPVYAQADIVVESLDGPPEETVERALAAIELAVGERRFAGA